MVCYLLYITIPSLDKVVYLVSCILYLVLTQNNGMLNTFVKLAIQLSFKWSTSLPHNCTNSYYSHLFITPPFTK